MLFQSPLFLFLFLPIIYLVFWSLPTRRSRHVWLTLASYAFYASWNPLFCLPLLYTNFVSYFAGRAFLEADAKRRSRRWRKNLLFVSLACHIAVLAFFKYAHHTAALGILFPLGLSFYTFHAIAYVTDCWRRSIYPIRSFWELSCYLTLFWKLLAGPIVRVFEIQEELEYLGANQRRSGLESGWSFFIIGLAQKVLIADTIGSVIDPALVHPDRLTTLGAWLCTLAYAYQIYFDLSGYSNMATGVARLFGMHMPGNMDSPYQALSPPDFWRRWHVTLSRFLSDYVFAAMGGGRGGERSLNLHLFLTMIVFALWHAASWNLVLWGSYHGLLLVLYRLFTYRWDRVPLGMQQSMTFALVTLGWIPFRSASWHDTQAIALRLFMPSSGPMFSKALLLTVILVAAMSLAHWGPNTFELNHRWSAPGNAALVLLLLASLIVIHGSSSSAFIYFRF